MSQSVSIRRSVSIAATIVLFACGGGVEKSGDGQPGGASSSRNAIEPCRLATAEEVAKLVPNHDGGAVAHSGPSLMQGIDVHQCSYMNAAPDLLTVIVHVAADQERFDSFKKSASYHSDHTAVAIGDRGWVWGEDDNVKVQVEKGRMTLDLELMANGAKNRSDAVVELARAIVTRMP